VSSAPSKFVKPTRALRVLQRSKEAAAPAPRRAARYTSRLVSGTHAGLLRIVEWGSGRPLYRAASGGYRPISTVVPRSAWATSIRASARLFFSNGCAGHDADLRPADEHRIALCCFFIAREFQATKLEQSVRAFRARPYQCSPLPSWSGPRSQNGRSRHPEKPLRRHPVPDCGTAAAA
jgi:hypothetical protein